MTIQHSTSAALALSGGDALATKLQAMQLPPADLSVADTIDRYMAVYDGRDGSRAQRMAAWVALLGKFKLSEVDSRLVRAARDVLAKQPALGFKGNGFDGQPIFRSKGRETAKTPATLNRYMQAFSALSSWAIEQELAPVNWRHPCRGVKRLTEADGRVRFLDVDERSRLFAECRRSKYPRLYALALTAMLTGARRGELLALRWGDVDLKAAVARLGKTKNGDRRTLVLLPQVLEALRPFAGDADRYVFGSVRSRHQEPAAIDSAWRDAVARAKIANFRFHDLRHCCASYLAQAGVPLNVIAEVLGHRKLDMAKRYSHLTTQTKADAMRAALGDIQ